jgi:hypothetical protein
MPDHVNLLKVDVASVYRIGTPIPYHGTERFAHPNILRHLMQVQQFLDGSSSSSGGVTLSIPCIAPCFSHSLHSLAATCVYWRGLTAARRLSLKLAGRDYKQLLKTWNTISEEDSFVRTAFDLANQENHQELETHLHTMIVDPSMDSQSS